MIVSDVEIPGGVKTKLVEYASIYDVTEQIDKRDPKYCVRSPDNGWAGGSQKDFAIGTERGSMKYVGRASKMIDDFANVAIKDYAVTLDWNERHGVLDYEAAMAGEVACMYGPTVEETDTAPIAVYLQNWYSSTLSAAEVEMRGIACLALVEALATYRPVHLKIVLAQQHRPSRTNIIQTVPVPTAPMDTARASWMIAAPIVARNGLFNMINQIAQNTQQCGLPLLSTNTGWQRDKMGDWLAARDNIHEVVHLPYMMDMDANWSTQEQALAWVKRTMKQYME